LAHSQHLIATKANNMRKFKNSGRRACVLSLTSLERRCLLSGTAAGAWVRQYVRSGDPPANDYTSWSQQLIGDNLQDAHISLSGLSGKYVSSINIDRYGSNGFDYPTPSTYDFQASLQSYTAGGDAAELYFQPNHLIAPGGPAGKDNGGLYHVTVYYSNSPTESFTMTDTYTYNYLVTPSQHFQETWNGQIDGHDYTGPDAGVGPDGIQDDRMTLSSFTQNPSNSQPYPVDFVAVTDPSVLDSSGNPISWESNLNLDRNADAYATGGPAGSTYLYINPSVKTGATSTASVSPNQTLNVTVHYKINGIDVPDTQSLAIGQTNVKLSDPAYQTNINWNGFTAAWSRQDSTVPGLVHVSLSNLPSTIQGATLSDQTETIWSYGTLHNQGEAALWLNQTVPTDDLTFAPDRNEASATLTLRLDFGGGTVSATQFAGSQSDPGLTQSDISPSVASPVNTTELFAALSNHAGTIYLSGNYSLTQSLDLTYAVKITNKPGYSATLTFSQPQPSVGALVTWRDAIQIDSSHVTLDGFAIRFSGVFHWYHEDDFNPAVIRCTTSSLRYVSVNLNNLDIQGPVQDVLDSAENAMTAAPPAISWFSDSFSGPSAPPNGQSWTMSGGTWTQNNGVLTQNSTDSGNKRLIVKTPAGFPSDTQITALVNIPSALSGDCRVGVGLNTDSSGNGYKLVFHDTGSGTLSVQLLNDGVAWSSPVVSDPMTNKGWLTGTNYWFKLLVMKDANGVDTLYGKVWPSGSSEPHAWTLTETGWIRSPGVPVLEGGSSGAPLALFQQVNAVSPTPQSFSTMFSDNFSGPLAPPNGQSWATGGGHWTQNNGVLTQDSTDSSNKRLIVKTPASFPSDTQILAQVQIPTALVGGSQVGVGLNSDSSGNGYKLAFHNTGSGTLSVQLLNDGVGSSSPVLTDSAGAPWSPGKYYWFRFLVIKDGNGVDTLYGKVWPLTKADGSQNPEPNTWSLTQTGWSRSAGAPALEGGSGGSATAKFQAVTVTTAATLALALMDLSATSGQVAGDNLTGGAIKLYGGPWNIARNTYHGALAGSYTDAFLEMQGYIFDLTATSNQLSQDNVAGRTLRFFNYGGSTASAYNDVIQSNIVNGGIGMGQNAGDQMWSPQAYAYGPGNNPEFMLAEAYLPKFEGVPSSITSGGRVLTINPSGLWDTTGAQAGDVVAILAGPNAGQYYRIAQRIDSMTYLMDQALPSGALYPISLAHGYNNLTIGGNNPGQGNTINLSGSASADFKLDGYQFGVQILGNHFTGGTSFLFTSITTNNNSTTPFPWGWTHTPNFGGAVDGNTFEDVAGAGLIAVNHSTDPNVTNNSIESNNDRTYFSGEFVNNVFKYNNPTGTSVTALTVGSNTVDSGGNPKTTDPGELHLTLSGNSMQAPISFYQQPGNVYVQLVAGTINGVPYNSLASQLVPLPLYNSLPPGPGTVQVNLSGAFNQIGASNDHTSGQGNFDGSGNSFSATALTSMIAWNNQTFAIVPPSANNDYELNNAPITLPQGGYTNLGKRCQEPKNDLLPSMWPKSVPDTLSVLALGIFDSVRLGTPFLTRDVVELLYEKRVASRFLLHERRLIRAATPLSGWPSASQRGQCRSGRSQERARVHPEVLR
jgi:hypothetical protein